MRDKVEVLGFELVLEAQAGTDCGGLNVGLKVAHAVVEVLIHGIPGRGVGHVGRDCEVVVLPAAVGAYSPERHGIGGFVQIATGAFGIAATDVEHEVCTEVVAQV